MSIWQGADGMQRIYKYLIPAAAALALVFSLGFFFGRRSVPFEAAIDTVPSHTQTSEETAEEEPSEPVLSADTQEQQCPVNINTATKEELMALPGVGEVLAERIIAYREQYGRFIAAEQLMDVSGIGEQRYAELAELVTVGD